MKNFTPANNQVLDLNIYRQGMDKGLDLGLEGAHLDIKKDNPYSRLRWKKYSSYKQGLLKGYEIGLTQRAYNKSKEEYVVKLKEQETKFRELIYLAKGEEMKLKVLVQKVQQLHRSRELASLSLSDKKELVRDR